MVRNTLWTLALLAGLIIARPAAAQMDTPQGIEDIKWRATLGTGVALETGGPQRSDPALLYFGGNVRKSWRWWYGLTLTGRADLYTGLTDGPMVPYKLYVESGLGLGPHIFRMELLHAEAYTDFGGIIDHSLGVNFRLKASTLPTFTGDVPIKDRHIVTYFVAPLSMVAGHYSSVVQQQTARDYNFKPYTVGELRVQERFLVTDWLHLRGGITLLKAYSNREVRFLVDLGVTVGILENAVQFGLDVLHDHWVTPAGFTENVATMTLSAKLRI